MASRCSKTAIQELSAHSVIMRAKLEHMYSPTCLKTRKDGMEEPPIETSHGRPTGQTNSMRDIVQS